MCSTSSLSRCALVALFLCLSAQLPGVRALGDELRTWTDITGKFQIEAKFLDVRDGKARLEKADGKIVEVPLPKLSKDDREHVRALAKARRAAQGPPGQSRGPNGELRLRAEEVVEGTTEVPPDGFTRQGGSTTTWRHSTSVEITIGEAQPAAREPQTPKRAVVHAKHYPGQRVEVRRGGKWRPATITESDPGQPWIMAREDNDSVAQKFDNANDIRPLSASAQESHENDPSPVTGFDFSKIPRVVASGNAKTTLEPDPANELPLALGSRSIEVEEPEGLDLLDFDITPNGQFAALWWADQFHPAYMDVGIDEENEAAAEVADEMREHLHEAFGEATGDQPPAPILKVVDLRTGRVRETAEIVGFRPETHNDALVALSPSGTRLIVDSYERWSDSLAIFELKDGKWQQICSWAPMAHVQEDGHVGGIDWIDDERFLIRNGYIEPTDAVVCWQAHPLKPLYQVRVPGALRFPTQFSPGRKQFFISSAEAIHAFDSQTGAHLADLGRDEQLEGVCAVSPDGGSIAASRGSELVVIDLSTGTVEEVIYSEQPLHKYFLAWLSDDLLLAQAMPDETSRQLHHQLYDRTKGIVLWRYRGLHSLNQAPMIGNELWQHQDDYLIAHALPDAAAKDARAGLSDEALIAVPANSTISVDCSAIAQQDFRDVCADHLKSLLQQSGHEVAADQSLRLVARVDEKERRHINFFFTDGLVHFHSKDPDESRSMIYPVREYHLELMDGDKIVWSRSRSNDIRPVSQSAKTGEGQIQIPLRQGETVDQAAERLTKLTPTGFGSQLPRVFVDRVYLEPQGTTQVRVGR